MFNFTKRSQPSAFASYSAASVNYILQNSSSTRIDGRRTWERLRNNTIIYKDLQKSLREESYFLCSYCGIRIDGENTSGRQFHQIEHLHPKSVYPSLTLNYNNLLACCYGDDGLSNGRRCGQSKGDQKLRFNQFSHGFEEKFSLEINGELIPCGNKAREYIDILNLNDSYLKGGRKSALDHYFDSFILLYDCYDPDLNDREQYFSDFLSSIISVDGDGKRGEYSSFVYFYYRKLIDNFN